MCSAASAIASVQAAPETPVKKSTAPTNLRIIDRLLAASFAVLAFGGVWLFAAVLASAPL